MNRRRPRRVDVHLNDAELRELLRMAAKLKVTRSEAVRMALRAPWVKTYLADKVIAA